MYIRSLVSNHNLPHLKSRRRWLRHKATDAERRMWKILHIPILKPYRFRRQFSVGEYILDFYSPSTGIAIEMDGMGHFTDEGLEYDERRDAFLLRNGIKVLRFENSSIFELESAVIDVIMEECLKVKNK